MTGIEIAGIMVLMWLVILTILIIGLLRKANRHG